MQIRTFFLVCMFAVATMTACLGGWMLTQMVNEYRLAGRIQRAVSIDLLLFAATDRISLERPVIGDALLGDAPVDATVRTKLTLIRSDADKALADLESRISGQSYPGAAAQLKVVRDTISQLAVWRAKVDEALSHPKNLRDPGIFSHYIAGLNGLFEATDTVLDIGDMAATLHDGTTVELMALSRYIWNVRSTTGVRTVPLMAAIDKGVALSPLELEAQARFDGALEANWLPIMALSRRLSDVPGIPETISTGRQAFDEFNRLCHTVIAASRSAQPYPLPALELGRNVVRTAPVLLKIRDDALAVARDRVARSRQDAGLYLAAAAIVLLLIITAMIAVLILLERRIVYPVLALTEVIGRLARLDFDVIIPARKRMDEIGRMALALDALRQGAMAGEENKAQIVHMARHDTLTGLPNRLTLQENLDQAVAMGGRSQTSAVLCLDLDRFKAVNDTFGHPTGDKLLQAVAERLLACVRDVDTVSRLGGDEFVILLIGVHEPALAGTIAQRVVDALSQPFDLDGQTVNIGCSVGIAITPQDATSAVALLKCADTALYRAKVEQAGTWRFFEPEMDAHLQERMHLERDLREAVQHEAFQLAYQPQYSLATNRLCGFEALLRWHHHQRGNIGPAAFIPVAEETGLIVPIGAWVLRTACAEAKHWPDDIRVAVNLSAVQFRNPTLVQTVRQALDDAGIAATRLELEITETVLLNNSAAALAMLQAFHDMGIRISMDDFGTGYSSLSYLRSFPFDTIKIDQTFVRDLSTDPGCRAIVRSVVALSNSLGMTTTAEGVETEEQLAELRLQGCTDAQGYLFSKPLWAAEARLLLSSPRNRILQVASPAVSAA